MGTEHNNGINSGSTVVGRIFLANQVEQRRHRSRKNATAFERDRTNDETGTDKWGLGWQARTDTDGAT